MSRLSCRETWLALVLGLLLLALALGAPAALAQGESPTEDEVNRIAKQLYCPVCENVPLDVCPTQACIQWRNVIREKLAAGWSEEQIKEYFVARYGDRVLATPPARGLNWLVYLLPPLALLAGATVVLQAIRSWRRGPSKDDAAAVERLDPDDPYVAQLEAELEARQGPRRDEGS